MGSHDPRVIANLMLDEADRVGVNLTNLALQKLIYFAHGIHLTQSGAPLVSGYFEAWQYGPVHPSTYRAFKRAGSKPITFRAKKTDLLTGLVSDLESATNPSLVSLMQRVLGSYGKMSPGRLVEISHAENSPWAYVVDKSRTSVAFGLRIPDNVIKERFRHHKVSIGVEPRLGEPSEDTPFT